MDLPEMDKIDKRVFATLFFSLFATVTGVGIVVPLLPVYAHDLGASGLYIGLIFGAFSLSRTIFLPYFGRRSDRQGRKPFIVAGLCAYAVISVAFIFSKSVEMLIFIRLVQGVASAMIMPVVQAYVGDITPPRKEGFVMGLFNISVFMGLSLGPLVGGAINDRFSLSASFGCMGALALVGFLGSLVFLPPTRTERALSRGEPPAAWRALLADREIAGLAVFRFTYTACIGVIWGFLPVFADGEFSLSSSAIGLLVMMGVLVSGVLQTPLGLLADRMNRRLMATVGGLIVVYAVASFAWSTGFWDLFRSNLIFGVGGGVSMVSIMAMAVDKGNSVKAMGSVMALMTMAHSAGMLGGSFLAGLMMDLFHLRLAFSIGAGIMLFGVGLFAMLNYLQSSHRSARSISIS